MNSISRNIPCFLIILMSYALTGLTDASQQVTTLFVGDSDIDYWKTDSKFSNSANVGVGGYTCTKVNKKIEKYLSDYPSAEWIVLVCGENDLWDESVTATFNTFMTIVNKIVADGSRRVVYMGTKPEPSTKSLHKKYVKYDNKIRLKAAEMALSSSTGIPPLVMVDVYPVFDDIEKKEPGKLYRNDKLHLSSYGYEFWTLWATTALKDDGTCIRWIDNQCDKANESSSPTRTPSPTPMVSSTPSPTPMVSIPNVIFADAGVNSCPSGYQKIKSVEGCMASLPLIDQTGNFAGTENDKKWPSRCYFCENVSGCLNGVWFNKNPQGKAKNGAKPVCALPGWEVCGDDIDWVKGKKGCSWVKKNPSKRCNRKGNNGQAAKKGCEYACRGNGSSCGLDCVNDKMWVLKTSSGKGKDCDWVIKDPTRRCSKAGEDGRLASEACKVSCIWHGSSCL